MSFRTCSSSTLVDESADQLDGFDRRKRGIGLASLVVKGEIALVLARARGCILHRQYQVVGIIRC